MIRSNMKKLSNRKIYLIRHAKPEFPTEEHYCVGGGTDWPIGQEGRRQCEQMAAVFAPILKKEKNDGRTVEFWSSPMLRARQTAQYLAEEEAIRLKEGLREAYAGAWDGKSFSWIRENYPEVYAARGKKHGMTLIPGAESNEAVLKRSVKALSELLDESSADDVVIVAHATIIQLLRCTLEGKAIEESYQFKPQYTEIICLPAQQLTVYLKRNRSEENG